MRGPELLTYDLGQGVCAFSTERRGGYSEGAYASFNANAYCGDEERMVRLNRDLLCESLGLEASRLIIPHQIHGARVRRIDEAFFMQADAVKAVTLEGVDAVMTDVPKVCVSVSTADCIPILIYDYAHHAAAAVHAGWRGTAKRIACKAVKMMEVSFGSRPEDLTAVIGPGISIDAFEVGDEVYAEFEAAGFNMADISRKEDKWHINLPECNCRQLAAMGLKEDNINVSGVCTYNNSNDYFSARKLGTESGRIFTGIILR